MPISYTTLSASAVALLLSGLGSSALGGCAQNLERGPNPGAPETSANIASETAQGVKVVARVDNWGGDADISSQVTPVRVTITNESGEPVAIRYSNFVLTDSQGNSYRALPLHGTGGIVEADKDVTEPGLELAARRSLAFQFAPYYKNVDPNLELYSGDFDIDAEYYTTYGPERRVRSLPTRTMWQAALPEGVLYDNGFLDGYLYFEKLPTSAQTANFRAVFEEVPQAGHQLATIDMPVQLASGD